jgi:hypothetical protein
LIVKYSFFQKISYFALSLSKRVDDMKNSIFFLCSLFICLFSLLKAEAQTPFQVLAAKNSSSNGKPIVLGQKLNPNQTIELGDSAFLLLQNKNQIWEVKAKGKYKIGDFIKEIGNSIAVNDKYLNPTITNLIESKERLKTTQSPKYSGKVEICNRPPRYAYIFLPQFKESEIYGNMAVFFVSLDQKNFSKDDFKEYRIYFTDLYDEIVLEQKFVENKIFIDLNQEKLKDQDFLIVKVIPIKKNGTQPARLENIDGIMIKRMDNEKSQEIKKELDKIQIPEAEALTKLVEARFFEEKGLLMDAVVAYFKAIELSNHCPQFKEMYEAFLIRNGLNEPETVAPDENTDK